MSVTKNLEFRRVSIKSAADGTIAVPFREIVDDSDSCPTVYQIVCQIPPVTRTCCLKGSYTEVCMP